MTLASAIISEQDNLKTCIGMQWSDESDVFVYRGRFDPRVIFERKYFHAGPSRHRVG